MFQVYYMLTNTCNLNCTHCIRGSEMNVSMMDNYNAIVGLEKLAAWNDNIMLILTGGEPTLHPKFDEILDCALRLFKRVVVNTNGTTNFFYQNTEHWVKEKKLLVQISIDGTVEYHNNIRGEGAFEKSISLLKYLKSRDIKVAVSTTVNKNNIGSMVELCDVLSELKIFKWHVSSEVPFGRAKLSECITAKQWNELVDILISKARILLGVKKIFNMNKIKELSDKDIAGLGRRSIYSCGTGRCKLYIDSLFNVHPCTCVKELQCGNILSESLSNIWSSNVMDEIRNLNVHQNSPCSQCRYLPICNGGCIGISKTFFGEFGYGDIRCEKVKSFYEQKKSTIF